MFRSDNLYLEILYVIENFSNHLISSLLQCVEMAKNDQAQSNIELVKTLYSVMNSILHIIESILSQEELPDFYEEQLPAITGVCLFILSQDYPKLQEVPEEITKARGKVVSLVYLYTFKFGEYFGQYQDPMFQAIWQMIVGNKVQPNKQCEKLVKITVKYLGEMANQKSKEDFYKMNLIKIFDTLILPNISITADDMDEYEDDPDAYIRNDLEESDVETRRRYCMKLVQQLSKKFSQDVTNLIGNYVNNYLADYQQNREAQWTKKTSLLNLLIGASISQYTFRSGAVEVLIDDQMLFSYIEQLVVPELQEQQVDNLPILKATCIKFVYMFRNQIPDDYVPTFIGMFCNFLGSSSTVNQSYAAACIEKLMLKKSKTTNLQLLNSENIDLNLQVNLLTNLCNLLNDQKNLFAIRCLYRVIQISQTKVAQFGEQLSQVL